MPYETVPASLNSHLKIDSPDLPDLTSLLKLVRIAATGSASVVYRCIYEERVEIAVKAISFPPMFGPTEKEEFTRKLERELRMWRKLEHPNIVPLLGTAHGKVFGSDYPCIVSTWTTNGTLFGYIRRHGTKLSLSDRIRLIKESVSGLEYLHSRGIVHGSIHPGNILIDSLNKARLSDITSSLPLFPIEDQFSHLWTDSIRSNKAMWAAPELVYPELYPMLEPEATFQSNIYSLGSIILLILSGKLPWRNMGEAENSIKKFCNPPRPTWPVYIPDNVWSLIERCWSPKNPGGRPSVQEVSLFCADRLEQLLRPNPASDINVVLFGPLGSGKSSVINLLSEKEIAPTSSGVDPCTECLRSYQIPLDGIQIRLWDTMGFFLADERSTNPLLPFEHAHTVLRNLPEGVNLILLCADKGAISPSLRRLYWLINDFFYGGRAPIAVVMTHFDIPDEKWWERNEQHIAERTGIPTHSIPYACVTVDPDFHSQSKATLKHLLRSYAISTPPIPLPYLSFDPTTSSDLAVHCKVTSSEAITLGKKFKIPCHPLDVIFCGETEAETSSIVNLIAGRPIVDANLAGSCRIGMGMRQLRVWVRPDRVVGEHEVNIKAMSNSARLIRDLSREGSIGLLVLCRRFGTPTSGECNCRKLFQTALFSRKPPIAVIAHARPPNPVEKWQKKDSRAIVKSMGLGDAIEDVYIPSLSSYSLPETGLELLVVESRLSVETMLEYCALSSGSRLDPRTSIMSFFKFRWLRARVLLLYHYVLGTV